MLLVDGSGPPALPLDDTPRMKARTSTTILSFLIGASLACAAAVAGGATVPEFAELDSDVDVDGGGGGGVSGEEYAQVNRRAFERLERQAI